jgi:type IV pilus assembly protein PilO
MELSLTKLPWYSQLGAFVVLAGVGVGAFVYYYEQPTRAEMSTREAQLATLKADVAKGRETARKLPEFKMQVEELESRLASLKAVLPEEKDAADLLRRMQTLATQSNLTITEFRPAAVVTKQLHAEWPIHLELSGTYHNLATFFDRISKFTRIVNISGLDVKGRDKQDPNSTIEAACVATTFVLLEKPQVDPKAAAAAQKPPAKKVA